MHIMRAFLPLSLASRRPGESPSGAAGSEISPQLDLGLFPSPGGGRLT